MIIKLIKISKKILLFTILIISTLLFGCSMTIEYKKDLLAVSDLTGISISAPEGSGSIRTLTIRYKKGGREESAAVDKIKRIDLAGYYDEKKEQTFTVSDYDGDGVFDIIVYREFWYPDINMPHAGIPEWPTVYEFDINKGFVIASGKHKDYFETYVKTSKEQLNLYKSQMEGDAILALNRLIYAAGKVADGSFNPQSPYNGKYYEDIYELTKDIVQ